MILDRSSSLLVSMLLVVEGTAAFVPFPVNQQSTPWLMPSAPLLPFCTRLSVANAQATKSDGDLDMEEELFLQAFDDDDEKYEVDMGKKGEWMEELRHLTRTTSTDPNAVQKAQDVFDAMFEAYVMTEETSMWPAVDVYNLLLEIHAYSRDPEGGVHAETLLARMEDPSVEFIARPNLETYMNVMDAWAMRRNPVKVEELLARMQTRYENTDDGAIQPTADVFNKLIKAYGMVGNVEKAEEIFVSLIDKDHDDALRANYKSWVQIMKAFASRQDGTDKVQALFREMTKEYRMGEEHYKPKTDAYNTVIRALGQKIDGAEEAEDILFDLVSRFRSGEKDVRPNADTFRNVLSAQRRRKNPSAAKVEQLLQIQEGLYTTTKEDDLRLDGRTYNVAIYTISRSRDSKKALRARRIVDKMRELDDRKNQINLRTYFNLFSACAFTIGSPEENLEAFQIAVDALKELRESTNQKPDSSCYGMFLKACANLMPESRKRDAVVENVFRKCCSDGLVDEFVLSEFERASSASLQLELLGGFLEDDVRVPEEWSKNVLKQEA
jgi:pentatricopeptide repeat protein